MSGSAGPLARRFFRLRAFDAEHDGAGPHKRVHGRLLHLHPVHSAAPQRHAGMGRGRLRGGGLHVLHEERNGAFPPAEYPAAHCEQTHVQGRLPAGRKAAGSFQAGALLHAVSRAGEPDRDLSVPHRSEERGAGSHPRRPAHQSPFIDRAAFHDDYAVSTERSRLETGAAVGGAARPDPLAGGCGMQSGRAVSLRIYCRWNAAPHPEGTAHPPLLRL